jgi:hypothetical protein
MKTGLVETGPYRFRRGKEAAVWKVIQAEYANKLASASPLKKLQIKVQMQREFLRRRKAGHEPSAGTLW